MSKKNKIWVGDVTCRLEHSYWDTRYVLDALQYLWYNGGDDHHGAITRLIETLELNLKMMKPHIEAVNFPDDEQLQKQSRKARKFMMSADYAASKL